MTMTHAPSYTAALAKTLNRFGLHNDHAEALATVVMEEIDSHANDIVPVEIWGLNALNEMDEVDDVLGMEQALGQLATALINIEDALA